MRKKADKKDDPEPKYKVGDVIRLNFVDDDIISLFEGQVGIILKVEKRIRLRYKILVCGIPNETFLFSENEISGKVENESKE